MILAAVLLPALACAQERPGLTAPSPSRQLREPSGQAAELLESVRARYAAAAALELDATLVQRVHVPEGWPYEIEESEWRSRLRVRLAKPLHGSLLYDHAGAGGADEGEGEDGTGGAAPSVRVVADGERLAQLDPEHEGWYLLGGTLAALAEYEQLEMLSWWAELDGEEVDAVTLEEAAGGRRVLVLERPLSTTRLVLDAGGLVASGWRKEREDPDLPSLPRLEASFAIARTILHEGPVDLEAWKESVPEGYTDLSEELDGGADLEASLLAAGSEAPGATLTGMEDERFTLASLRGKTVLLNFWFYH